MTADYSDKLREQLADYAQRRLAGTGERRGGDANKDPHTLSKAARRANILPLVRERFWSWFETQTPKIELQARFEDLDSSQAMAFNLFFPFLNGTRVDARLLKVLGLAAGEYDGRLETIVEREEGSRFALYMEARSGLRIFVDVKLAQDGFAGCAEDERHRGDLERRYRPDLEGEVDAKWLERDTFFGYEEILRKVSYLGRHPDSGIVFIFPRANERLKASEQAIKQIVSKSLAPRVAILYLEYLVERILEATSGDALLREHFLEFRDKYICV